MARTHRQELAEKESLRAISAISPCQRRSGIPTPRCSRILGSAIHSNPPQLSLHCAAFDQPHGSPDSIAADLPPPERVRRVIPDRCRERTRALPPAERSARLPTAKKPLSATCTRTTSPLYLHPHCTITADCGKADYGPLGVAWAVLSAIRCPQFSPSLQQNPTSGVASRRKDLVDCTGRGQRNIRGAAAVERREQGQQRIVEEPPLAQRQGRVHQIERI
jgi:hypothetical protein